MPHCGTAAYERTYLFANCGVTRCADILQEICEVSFVPVPRRCIFFGLVGGVRRSRAVRKTVCSLPQAAGSRAATQSRLGETTRLDGAPGAAQKGSKARSSNVHSVARTRFLNGSGPGRRSITIRGKVQPLPQFGTSVTQPAWRGRSSPRSQPHAKSQRDRLAFKPGSRKGIGLSIRCTT